MARGAAYADFDHDGDLDILVTTNNGPAYLFRNDGGNANHWLHLKLEGTKSNRSAIGAVVRVESARRQAVADRAQRIELLFAKRTRPDLRAWARTRRQPRSTSNGPAALSSTCPT